MSHISRIKEPSLGFKLISGRSATISWETPIVQTKGPNWMQVFQHILFAPSQTHCLEAPQRRVCRTLWLGRSVILSGHWHTDTNGKLTAWTSSPTPVRLGHSLTLKNNPFDVPTLLSGISFCVVRPCGSFWAWGALLLSPLLLLLSSSISLQLLAVL